jgi:hypothetical protein
VHKGRTLPARVETVVIFLPDVWSCNPSRLEWEQMASNFKKQLSDKLVDENKEEGTQALIVSILLSSYHRVAAGWQLAGLADAATSQQPPPTGSKQATTHYLTLLVLCLSHIQPALSRAYFRKILVEPFRSPRALSLVRIELGITIACVSVGGFFFSDENDRKNL